jgi:polyferredoxin
MLLDFLPWSVPKEGRVHRAGMIRYIHFFISLAIVLVLWFGFQRRNFGQNSVAELYWLIAGNMFYYVLAVVLAARLRDNRAFCKYVCPIPTLMKIGSRFALAKIEIDAEQCTECGLCEKQCPMNIRLLDYKRLGKRIQSTECILCQNCANVCPEDAVKTSTRLDAGVKEFIQYRSDSGQTDRVIKSN